MPGWFDKKNFVFLRPFETNGPAQHQPSRPSRSFLRDYLEKIFNYSLPITLKNYPP